MTNPPHPPSRSSRLFSVAMLVLACAMLVFSFTYFVMDWHWW